MPLRKKYHACRIQICYYRIISFLIHVVIIQVFFKYMSKIRVESDTDRNTKIQQSRLYMCHLQMPEREQDLSVSKQRLKQKYSKVY